MLRILLAAVLALATSSCLSPERRLQGVALHRFGQFAFFLPSDGSGLLKLDIGGRRLRAGDCAEIAIQANDRRTTMYETYRLEDRTLRIAHTPDPPVRARIVRSAAYRRDFALCELPRLEEFSGVLSCTPVACFFRGSDWGRGQAFPHFNPVSERQFKALAGLASEADWRQGGPYRVRVRGLLRTMFDVKLLLFDVNFFIVSVEAAESCPTCEPIEGPIAVH